MGDKKSWIKRSLVLFLVAVLIGNSAGWTMLTVLAEEETTETAEITVMEDVSESEGPALPETAGLSEDREDADNTQEETDEDKRFTGEGTISAEDKGLPDNEELLAGYIEQLFFGNLNGGISLFGDFGTIQLNVEDRAIYETLKTYIQKVASGLVASTTFKLDSPKMTLSLTDGETLKEAVGKRMDAILDYLLLDNPFDFYWFDKTKGMSVGYSYSVSDKIYNVNSIEVSFAVSSDFSTGAGLYQVDTSKISLAKTAADNAKKIVKDYEGVSDYEKLTAYCKKICELTSYATNAAENQNTPYGHPWQLIYVFDGDDTTRVVCEGYAKAFQYLCDLSSFSEGTACYTVTGTMRGGTGSGGHMWNIVTLGGKNYLVDVTNCDDGTSGAPDKLFLAGTSGSAAAGYTFTFSSSSSVTYTYDTNQAAIFKDTNILTLADKNYEQGSDIESIEFVVGNQPAAISNAVTVKQSPVYGDSWSDIVKIKAITARVGNANDSNAGHFTLDVSGIPDAGEYTFKVLYNGTLGGKSYVNTEVLQSAVNVEKKAVTVNPGTYKISKVYDGTTAPGTASGKLEIVGRVSTDTENDFSVTAVPVSFSDAGAGKQTEMKVPLKISGTKAGNYIVSPNEVTVPCEIKSNDSIVSIPDAELKSRLLAKGFDENGDGELSETEMKKITYLDLRTNVYGTNITDLTGLETAVNVETFLINTAEIQDFSVLSSMSNLNTVGINNSEINTSSLMASLRSCSNLETIDFNMMGADFVDISGLGVLTQIKSLNLYATCVSDISEVANLTNLQRLILDSTKVSDLSPLTSCKNLKELSIQDTYVTNLTPLAACSNLEILSVGYDLDPDNGKPNGITDISALASCKNLKELSINHNTAITAEMIFDALTPDEQTCNLSIGTNNIILFSNCRISIPISGTIEYNFGAKNMTWASENPDIVEVTEDFKFNAKQAGKTRVTATFGNISKIFNITVTDSEQSMDFNDVQEDAWYYNTVDYIFKSGLMTGLDNRHFGPNQSLARAQFAVIMHRKEGSPDVTYAPIFKDVVNGQWYTKPILWANEAGVVKGYTNGCFGPGDAINREQMAVIMYRYAGINGYDTKKRADISSYSDSNRVSDYSKQAVQWCVAEGIITGKNQGTILDPQGNATRAECAAIIKRFVEKYN